MAANSSDHYLSKAYGRFMDDMLGYSRNPDGSINWTARAARFSSGAMKAKRPGSGLDTNRSCIYGDYDYWNYLLDK
jgi:hypothetical protein